MYRHHVPVGSVSNVRSARRGSKSEHWSPLGSEFERHGGFVEWVRAYWVALVTIGVLIVVAVLIVIMSVLASRPTTVTDRSICARIDSIFYYPTVPASGYKVSRQSATEVETLLRTASLEGLRNEAEPLQHAIDSNNEAETVHVFSDSQTSVCTSVGITPAT